MLGTPVTSCFSSVVACLDIAGCMGLGTINLVDDVDCVVITGLGNTGLIDAVVVEVTGIVMGTVLVEVVGVVEVVGAVEVVVGVVVLFLEEVRCFLIGGGVSSSELSFILRDGLAMIIEK